jgi:magnesium-transporting ATPase (P-type)
MELEELKTLWKVESEKEVSTHHVNLDEVRGVIARKSQSTITDVKKTMKLKVAVTGITSIICLATVFFGLTESLSENLMLDKFMNTTQMVIMYSILGISLGIIAVFNFFNHIRITDFERSVLPIKETIQHVAKIIKGAMNLGTYSDLIVSPFIFAFVGYVFFYREEVFQFDIRVFYLILVYVGGLAFSYVINKFAMQKRFGDDLDRLKGYLKELEL